MEKIKNGIVFSDDIKRIFSGVNAFDYSYACKPNDSVIEDVRKDFKLDADKIFNGNVTIISEDEMMGVNNLIGGEYPHRNFR
ncbi:MAG: hypothetical protein IJO63_04190 [Bacilli bacterium]|nr:hypothetical protein [Bacilli bacterium]